MSREPNERVIAANTLANLSETSLLAPLLDQWEDAFEAGHALTPEECHARSPAVVAAKAQAAVPVLRRT